MMKELAAYLRGWKSYFGFCQTPSLLKVLEEWIRRRLRSMIWKQWKRGKQRYAKLRQRGVGKALAAQTAGSPHRPWHLANSPALSYALPIAYFDSLGLPRRFGGNAKPSEPPYADPHLRWCGRGGRVAVPPMPIGLRRKARYGLKSKTWRLQRSVAASESHASCL